jgi:hypothetical protein
MNTANLPSDNGIALPPYTEANTDLDLEAPQPNHTCWTAVCQKLELVLIYSFALLVILVLLGVFAYEMYIQYHHAVTSRVRNPSCLLSFHKLTRLAALDLFEFAHRLDIFAALFCFSVFHT